MSSPRTKFQDLLRKLFPFDCAELAVDPYRFICRLRSRHLLRLLRKKSSQSPCTNPHSTRDPLREGLV